MKIRAISSRAASLATVAILGAGVGVLAAVTQTSAAGYCSSPGVGVLEASDTSASAKPSLTFKYTITTPRSQGEMLFYALKPAGTWDNKTTAELIALSTLKINGVTKSPGIFLTSNGGVYSGAVMYLELAAGYSLAAGDQMELTFDSGAFTNPATNATVTWVWRTADAGGRYEQCWSATLVYGSSGSSTTSSTTSTTEASTTTTSPATTTTSPATTTSVAGATTTVAASTTSVAGATTTVGATELTPEPLENRKLPELTPGGSAFTVDGKDTPLIVTGSGGRVSARAGAFSIAIAGARGGSAVPLGVGASQTLPAGSKLSVTGQGFKPGTAARLWLVNGKALLGNATVGTDGSVVLSGDLASSLAPGTYTIQVAGTGADGKVRAVSLGFTITAPADGDLTSTGGRSDLWTLMAIALVLMGIVATNGRIVRDEA